MKQIRVGIIGQGRSGRDIHADHIMRDARRYRVVAAVDPLKDRRERAARELKCDVYRDHYPLLKRDDLDLIVNATPSRLHVPVSLEVLRAGHNCLCEKPLAARAKDVDRLIAASKKSGKILAVYQQSRYAPYFRQVRKVVASGVLGRIAQISMAFNGWARRWDWQTLTELDGGSLMNTGPHPVDQALQLFGTDVMPNVTCFMDAVTTYGNAEDHVFITLSGKGRPLIHLEISSCCAYPCFTYQVYGSRGGLKGDAKHIDWRYYVPGENQKQKLTRKPICQPDGTPAYCGETLKWHQRSWDVPKLKSSLFSHMAGCFYRMFYKTLTAGAALEITLEQVRQQIAVIEECHRQNPHIYGRKKKRH